MPETTNKNDLDKEDLIASILGHKAGDKLKHLQLCSLTWLYSRLNHLDINVEKAA